MEDRLSAQVGHWLTKDGGQRPHRLVEQADAGDTGNPSHDRIV
jgi:hypothetical protein